MLTENHLKIINVSLTPIPVRGLLHNPSIGVLCLCGLGGGDTHDIAEPTYKTFNLPTRLSTYLLDINPTAYKTFNLPTRQKPDRN